MILTDSSTASNKMHSCAICGSDMSLDQLTAGLMDIRGQQHFACYGHSWDNTKLINGWAAFSAQQRSLIETLPQARHERPQYMPDTYIEQRPITGSDVISWDIAHHLFARQLPGVVVIVTSNPLSLSAALRKQWLRMTRRVQRERSSTLDAMLIQQLTNITSRMQNTVFTHKTPYEQPEANIYILSNDYLEEVPPNCHTLYLVETMSTEKFAVIREAIPYQGLLVTYR